MKNDLVKILALMMCLCMVLGLTACGGSGSKQHQEEPKADAAEAPEQQDEPAAEESGDAAAAADLTPRVYEVASGSSTGAYYLQITPIASLWEQLDFVSSCSVQATTGALENTVLISTGAADAGLIDTYAYYAAVNGTEPYEETYGGFSALAVGTPSLCTIVVRADSDIKSIADLKGHSIAVGAAGSGAEFEERYIMEALGMGWDDFSQVDMVGIGPGLTNFQDGKDDAVILLGGAGNSSVMEAMTNVDVRFLSFSDEELATVLESCPFAVEDVIPANSYTGLEEDVQTVSVPCVLVVSDDLSEEEVYQMTDKIYTNLEDLKASNVNFETWSFGLSCAGNIPLHPGAEKYYSDNGIQ